MLNARNTPGEDSPAIIQSRLMPELLSGFEPGQRLTVLDLGPGNPSTVNFFSQFASKIIFADLLDHPIIRNPPQDIDTTTLSGFITRQIAMPPGSQVDICLLWDFLHYIDLPTIAALSSVIKPWLHGNSAGYGFGALHGTRPSDTNDYGIHAIDALAARPTEAQPTYFAHSQQRLNEHFVALKIVRGTLLREGRLELLFGV